MLPSRLRDRIKTPRFQFRRACKWGVRQTRRFAPESDDGEGGAWPALLAACRAPKWVFRLAMGEQLGLSALTTGLDVVS